MSVVKAIKDYFGDSRKVTIEEFKSLTPQDKRDFVEMLREIGWDVSDYHEAK